ncbi:MAG: phage head-tail adapter protein [Hyphomicrobiales bacterium]|nr:MAG: phage head-tail adapter protein [Hyphomicrobiales bacterium]
MVKPIIQSGSFRRRVTLQEETETPDGCGGFTTGWVSVSDIWAQITPVGSASISRADNVDQEVTHTVMVRKTGNLQQGMRLLFGSRIFLINSVYDPDETGRYTQCDVREQSS